MTAQSAGSMSDHYANSSPEELMLLYEDVERVGAIKTISILREK